MSCCGSSKRSRPQSATLPPVNVPTVPKTLEDVMAQVEGELTPLDELERMSTEFLKRKEWATGRPDDLRRLKDDFEGFSQLLLSQNRRIGLGFWAVSLLNDKVD